MPSRPWTGRLALLIGSLVCFSLLGFGAYRLFWSPRPALAGAPLDHDADAFTIYVFGGSTAYGVPYGPRCDFARIACWLFGGTLNGRRIEVRNLAGSGADTACALEPARALPRAEGNALAFVYSGDNEFLIFDKEHDPEKPRVLFDTPIVPADRRERVLADYERTLEELVDVLSAKGIEVVLATVATNLADNDPSRSVLADPANEPRVAELLAEGEALHDGDPAAAIEHYDAALAIEPGFAWLHLRRAEALEALGRFDQARAAYQASLDHDGMPNCVQSSQNAAVRALASRRGIPLVDGERVVREAAPNGLPGFELFWDNSHPTLEGHFLIASELARVVEQRFSTRRARTEPDLAALEEALGLGGDFELEVLIGRAQYNYGRSVLTWNPARRLARARECLDRAAALDPDGAMLLASRGVLALLEGELDESRAFWQQAYRADPVLARERLQHGYLRKVLKKHGVDDPESMFTP